MRCKAKGASQKEEKGKEKRIKKGDALALSLLISPSKQGMVCFVILAYLPLPTAPLKAVSPLEDKRTRIIINILFDISLVVLIALNQRA